MSNPIISGNVKSISALLANSTAAHTTTLGPFTLSNTSFNNSSAGLWLLYLEILYGIPSAAISEDILLQDITGATFAQWHMNMGVAPADRGRVLLLIPYPGLISFGFSAGQQQWSISTPATVSGPGYSVNMSAYIA